MHRNAAGDRCATMNNAAAGSCPFDVTAMENFLKAGRVVTQKIAGKNVGQCFESAMRMIVHIAASFRGDWSRFIEKQEWIDMIERMRRKRPADRKTSAFDLMLAKDCAKQSPSCRTGN